MPESIPVPAPLKLAALLTVLESVVLVVLAIVQVVTFSGERVAMNVTTTAFFVLYAAVLALCARALLLSRSWARSPIVLAQLIQLGVAWSFVQGDPGKGDKAVAWLLAALSVAVLVGIFNPRSIHHLESVD